VSDIVFKIGPRINASGRIQNGKEAVDLLIEKDFSAALEKAGQINQYNETRKDLDKSMTEEANKIVAELEGLAERRSIVLYNEERSDRNRCLTINGDLLSSGSRTDPDG